MSENATQMGLDLESQELVKEAAEVADKTTHGDPDTVVLSNGVVLRIKPVPPFAIQQAALKLKPPPVPEQMNAEKGRREPNPNDPDYRAALEDYSNRQGEMISNVVIILGTKLESCPEAVTPIESDDWIEALNAIGFDINGDNKNERYLSWVRYVALESADDVRSVVQRAIARTGATEEDVQQAVTAFRNK